MCVGFEPPAYYNGIVFRKTPECLHYAEVKLDDHVTPISSLVQQYVDNGATRRVKATGIDIASRREGKRGKNGQILHLRRRPVHLRLGFPAIPHLP